MEQFTEFDELWQRLHQGYGYSPKETERYTADLQRVIDLAGTMTPEFYIKGGDETNVKFGFRIGKDNNGWGNTCVEGSLRLNDREETVTHLSHIVIAGEMRKQGIGERLVRYFAAQSILNDAVEMTSEVVNGTVIRIFQRVFGDERLSFFHKDEDGKLLTLPIDAVEAARSLDKAEAVRYALFLRRTASSPLSEKYTSSAIWTNVNLTGLIPSDVLLEPSLQEQG